MKANYAILLLKSSLILTNHVIIMEYRQLGQTDIRVSAITFGAWAIGGWMWGGTERKDAIEAIKASYDHGVTSIDTAPIYGQGLSEELVGEALQSIPRDKVQVLTKFGMRWDDTKGDHAFTSADNDGNTLEIYKYSGRESIIKECEDSLRRLQTDYIDLYQIHWPDITTPIEESMEAVSKLLKAGKIRAAGVSNYNAAQMEQAEKVLPIASNQVPYSMLERSIEKELVPYCIKHKKSIIAYSPLQRGLLTGKIKPGHSFAAGDSREGNRFYTAENIERVNDFINSLQPLADSKKALIAQLVLRWTIEQPGITVALAGARNAEQAIQNAQTLNVRLTKEELAFIDGQLQQLDHQNVKV
jgi:aryl-alcohol dehydrogenase-like predicted oxidoreductase